MVGEDTRRRVHARLRWIKAAPVMFHFRLAADAHATRLPLARCFSGVMVEGRVSGRGGAARITQGAAAFGAARGCRARVFFGMGVLGTRSSAAFMRVVHQAVAFAFLPSAKAGVMMMAMAMLDAGGSAVLHALGTHS